LIAQATATAVSSDGTTLTFNTPNLSSVPPAEYAGIVSNKTANGTYTPVGGATAFVATAPSGGGGGGGGRCGAACSNTITAGAPGLRS
ncbi:MAG TPA: hypothetical protein VHT24_02470, partial [Pseudacidobacterium sp.]|nr:hypothetical protein [Pseudacidobacterium sp.]